MTDGAREYERQAAAAWSPRFQCRNCMAHFAKVYAHPTLGAVCPICLRPVSKRAARRRSKRQRASARKRRALARIYGWVCHLCREAIDPGATGPLAPTLDHVIPISKGGGHGIANLRLAHRACNQRRSSQPLPWVKAARASASGRLYPAPMAVAVDEHAVVRVVANVESAVEETIRNDGPDAVTLSKDPAVVAGGGFQLALNATQDVSLAPGEGVYAITAAGKTASLEVI